MRPVHRPLTTTDLTAAGPLRRLGTHLVCLGDVDSTNTYLRQRADLLPDGAVVSAEWQSAGRGRHGRRWLAPRGSSVMLSILLHESTDSPLLGGATLAASLAVCEALAAATTCTMMLRWPNDLVSNGRKLAGVLAESTPLAGDAPPDRRRALIIGIGVNCLQQAGHFPPELSESATALEIESATPIDRAAIAGALLARLDLRLCEYAESPAARQAIQHAWKARCHDLGARVDLRHDGRRHSGTVLDVSDQGALLVQLDVGGRRWFESATTTRCG